MNFDKFVACVARWHRWIIAALLVVLIFCLAGCSDNGQTTFGVPPAHGQAGTDTVSWTNAIEWTDGSPLLATQLVKVSIQWGGNPNGPFTDGTLDVATTAPGAKLSATIERQTVGNRCYVMFTHAREVATGPLIVSNGSNVVCKTIKGPPKPPSGVTVN